MVDTAVAVNPEVIVLCTRADKLHYQGHDRRRHRELARRLRGADPGHARCRGGGGPGRDRAVPRAELEDAAYVLERTTGVAGIFGASSMDRLSTEVAMPKNMKRFKALASRTAGYARRCALPRQRG
jgi:Phosphoenolpyruvate hydrolase-like